MKTKYLMAVFGLAAAIGGCDSGGGRGGNGGNGGNGGGGSGGSGAIDMAIPPGPVDMAQPADLTMLPDLAQPVCQYPAGPYGVKKGSILDPTQSWQCVKPGETAATTMTVKDFFDCDGSRHINAVLFDLSATWCPACNAEADEEESAWTSRWMNEGVVAVTLMIEDKVQGSTPTVQTALNWIKAHNLKHIYVCADTKAKLYDGNGIPMNVFVDPRKMKIVDTMSGYDPDDRTLDQIAKANAL